MEDITFCKKNKINAELTFLRKGDIASYVSLDHEVLTQPEAALQSILEEMQSPSPQPSPWKGEGDYNTLPERERGITILSLKGRGGYNIDVKLKRTPYPL